MYLVEDACRRSFWGKGGKNLWSFVLGKLEKR